MTKLLKQIYYSKKGEEKINCYHVYLSKDIIKEAGMEDTTEVKIKTEKGKIVIEKG